MPTKRLPPKTIPLLSETQKAYLAGLFDGEGTVSIYESSCRSRGGDSHIVWQFGVGISNTSLKVLDYVRSLVDAGTIKQKTQKKSHWRQGYEWRISGDKAADFMCVLRPYCIIKADQIDEALIFRALRKPRYHRQTDIELTEKRAVVLRIKELKRA